MRRVTGSPGKFTVFDKQDGIPSNIILSIHEDGTGAFGWDSTAA